MQKFAIAAIAAALVTTAAAPVMAGEAWQVGNSSYHLYLTDLDLHTATGRAEALTRVETIAARLCGTDGVRSEQKACIARTVAAATHGSAAAALQLALSERGSRMVLAQAR